MSDRLASGATNENADFLLELRSEEIPARMQLKAKDDLARLFTDALAKAGLAATSIETFATPRRLALIAHGLPLSAKAVSEETKGPKVGAPPQALEGFLRKTGLMQDQLVERDGIYFAVIDKPGRATADVLAEAIPAIIRAFPWPKSQRWGAASISTESLRWVRPLQGIIALLGDDVVPCEIEGITSGRDTNGHRFHSSGLIPIANAASYIETLRATHVIVHYSERCRLIRDGATAAASAAGLVLVEDEGLVSENAGLTEWPVPMLGRFDPAFLEVPEEVIQLTARVNQKYFICRDAAGALAPAFICTANIDAHDGGAAIVAGNEKVLAARLSDAKFFWESDLKIPLADQAAKLSQITFHEKLGSVADKVERVAKLAEWLATEGIVPNCDPALARRAAELCKADLVTGSVGEFPELQGIMGGHLARAQGEPDAIADAIRDHYKPVGQGDDVPTAPVTVAVSLADKLDTLFAFFMVGEKPTGSKDPFALRRSTLGILALLQRNGLRLPFLSIMPIAFAEVAFSQGKALGIKQTDLYIRYLTDLNLSVDQKSELLRNLLNAENLESSKAAMQAGEVAQTMAMEAPQAIGDFLTDRLKVQQREAGVRHDLIDAVFALGGEDDLVRLLARVHALQAFIGTEDGANLLAGYKRATKILTQQAPHVKLSHAEGHENELILEGQLEASIALAEPNVLTAINAERFHDAMAILATLKTPIYSFMDGVLVFHPNADLATRRLDLLRRFRDAVHAVADFSKIEG